MNQNRSMHWGGAAVMAVLASATGVTTAATVSVELEPSQDSTIYDESDIKSNGVGEFLHIGRTNMGAIRRTLIQFDVASAIPADARVVGAQLTMTLDLTVALPEDITLNRVVESWTTGLSDAPGGEGNGAIADQDDVTWRYRSYDITDPNASPQWAVLGGTFVPTVSATATVGVTPGETTTWSSAQLVQDVQSWLDGSADNFGWILIGDEEAIPTAKRMISGDNADASARPVLRVTYAVNAGASPCSADCAPDNGDGTFGNGIVNVDDLLAVINAFGGPGGPCDSAPDNGNGTFGNGVVNIDDLLTVINAFGDCP